MDKMRFRTILAGEGPTQRPNTHSYETALLRFYERYGDFGTKEKWSRDDRFKKYLFLTVRFVRYGRKRLQDMVTTEEDAGQQVDLLFGILEMVSLLTPKGLTQMFPIEKKYHGRKNHEKDYFCTMKTLQDLDWDKSIKEQTDFF